jgi:hypothetical protein
MIWCCRTALDAANAGRLLWDKEAKAWTERSVPLRKSSALAVFHFQQGISEELHGGEPYTWVDCPYCQGVLPKG